MTPQKGFFVLGHELGGAGGENGDFLLDFLDVIFTGFEVDLAAISTTSSDGEEGWVGQGAGGGGTYMFNGNNLSRLSFDSFVDYAETATLRDVLAFRPSYPQPHLILISSWVGCFARRLDATALRRGEVGTENILPSSSNTWY